MKISHCQIAHADERGIIRDIFPSRAPDSVTVITHAKGSIRGNHVHMESTQWLYVVSGGPLLAYVRNAEHGFGVERHELYPGNLIQHDPREQHAYQALADTIAIAFADGLRKGSDYERDTQRVPSLVDEWHHTRGLTQ